MPLCTIDDFEREVLILGSDNADSYTDDSPEFSTSFAANKEFGIFVFYQADVDGLCALFILEVCICVFIQTLFSIISV